MANIIIKNVSIKGIAACAPQHIESNLDVPVFNEGEAERVIAQTGIRQKHTVPDGNMLASDMCVAACEKLLEELGWEKESVDVLGFVSLSADYLEPPTACILQDRLGHDASPDVPYVPQPVRRRACLYPSRRTDG